MPFNLRQYSVTERSPSTKLWKANQGDEYVSHNYRRTGSPGQAIGGTWGDHAPEQPLEDRQ
jgi:hypothetical protein